MIYIIPALVLTLVEVLIVKYLMCLRVYEKDYNRCWEKAKFIKDVKIEIPVWGVLLFFAINLVPIMRFVIFYTALMGIMIMSIVAVKTRRPDDSESLPIFRGDIGSFFRRTI